MTVIKVISAVAICFFTLCVQAQTDTQDNSGQTRVAVKNWPATADELLAKKQINFTTPSTRRRVDLQEKTYQIFATRVSNMCHTGVIPVEISKLSPYQVEIHIPPKHHDDPNRRGMCYGWLILIDLQVQKFTHFEYYGDRSNLRGPFGYSNLSFD